jgi:hypothetical protein
MGREGWSDDLPLAHLTVNEQSDIDRPCSDFWRNSTESQFSAGRRPK